MIYVVYRLCSCSAACRKKRGKKRYDTVPGCFRLSMPFWFFYKILIRDPVARWESNRMSCFRSWCLLIELPGIVFLAAVRTSGFPTSHVSDFALWLLCDTAQSSNLFPFISRRLFPLDRAIGFFVVTAPRAGRIHVPFPIVGDQCAARDCP